MASERNLALHDQMQLTFILMTVDFAIENTQDRSIEESCQDFPLLASVKSFLRDF